MQGNNKSQQYGESLIALQHVILPDIKIGFANEKTGIPGRSQKRLLLNGLTMLRSANAANKFHDLAHELNILVKLSDQANIRYCYGVLQQIGVSA